MAIVLNWFRCDINPAVLKLYVRDFPSIEAAKSHRATVPDAIGAYLWVGKDRSGKIPPVQLVAVNGSDLAGGYLREIDVSHHAGVAKRVVRGSIVSFFRSRRFLVDEDRFGGGVSVLEAGTLASQFVRVRTGVRVKVDYPFREGRLGLICQWAVRAEVEGTLVLPDLAQLAVGLPCILELSDGDHGLPVDVRNRDRKLLGTIESVEANDCVVKLRGGGRQRVPRRCLRLDAGAAAISRLDQQFANSATIRPAFQQIQRASLALGNDNRRNPSVLKDRLAAIRRFLGGDAPSLLVVPLPGAPGAKLTVDMRPVAVKQEAA